MPDPIAKIKHKLQEEIDQLEHELNVELPKEIAVARAHGDLSENAEYKYAKERQGFVNARIGQAFPEGPAMIWCGDHDRRTATVRNGGEKILAHTVGELLLVPVEQNDMPTARSNNSSS